MEVLAHGSLESGLGGFDYAADAIGWENVFHCEINPFCRTILKYYWPKAKSYADIFNMDGRPWMGKVDIITAGFPCQPFSHAGKRKGSNDDRHIWPENLRIIKEVQPPFVLAENVPGLLTIEGGLVFEQVCADLENEGYEIAPFIIPAVAKDAVHRRDRVWIIGRNASYCNKHGQRDINGYKKDSGTQGKSKIEGIQRERVRREPWEENPNVTNTKRQRLQEPEQGEFINGIPDAERNNSQVNSNAPATGLERCNTKGGSSTGGWNSEHTGCRESWIEAATRLCSVDDEHAGGLDIAAISKSQWRTESLKGYGNMIYWPVAYEIFKVIDYLNKV